MRTFSGNSFHDPMIVCEKKFCLASRQFLCLKYMEVDGGIDVGTGGTGGTCPQDFAINKEVPFSF